MRLIDADELNESVNDKYYLGYIERQERNDLVDFLRSAPIIDAEPVRHGRWIWSGECWECSVCGCMRFHDLVLGLDAGYCGRCGAKMDGE